MKKKNCIIFIAVLLIWGCGQKNGTQTEYYSNGNKQGEGNYKEGYKVGKHTSWDENGKVSAVIFYSGGSVDSGTKFFYHGDSIEVVKFGDGTWTEELLYLNKVLRRKVKFPGNYGHERADDTAYINYFFENQVLLRKEIYFSGGNHYKKIRYTKDSIIEEEHVESPGIPLK